MTLHHISFWLLSQLLLWSSLSSYRTFFVTGYNYTLIWEDGEKQLYRVRENDTLVNTYRLNSQMAAEVAPLSDGYVVTWTSIMSSGSTSGNVQMQLMDSYAEKKQDYSETQVTDSTHEPVWADVATSATTGNYFVVWSSLPSASATKANIYGQLVSPAGKKLGEAIRINTYDARTTYLPKVVPYPSGNFLVVWQAYDSYTLIYEQELYPDGTPAYSSESFIQLAYGEITVNAATLTNDTHVLVWNSDGNIIAQLCWRNGYKISSEIQVNSLSSAVASAAEVAPLTNGGFVVTWTFTNSDLSSHVYVQLMNGGGGKVDSAFQASEYTTSSQKWSRVATLPEGFVVIWNDDSRDGNEYGIYGQVFSNNGTRVGTEFLVNTLTIGEQTLPSVTGFLTGELAGGFAVAWRSYGPNTNDYDVYTQLFLLEEPPSAGQAIEAQLAYADHEFTFTIPQNAFYDPNQDVWSITASGVPNWLIYTEATWEFSGVPSVNDVGTTLYINLTAMDEFGGEASTSFELTVQKMATTTTTEEEATTEEPASGVKGISVAFVAGLVLLSLSFVTDGIF